MRRRDKTGGKAAKGRRGQAMRRRNTGKVARRREPYAADANEKVALLEQKLNEALEQQTAMSEILGVISNSPTDLAPVFSAILTNATRLCEGNLAALWRYDGKFLIGAAQYNASAAFVDKYMGTKMEPGRAGPARLAALERRTVHVADITAEPGFSPVVLQYERARSVLAVPLLREKDLVGVIAIWRREIRPFTDKQIELVGNFAAQAVIAIENARLLGQLRESLAQQTATADVLKAISGSAFDLRTVLDTLVKSAALLCEADMASINRPSDGKFHQIASYSYSPEFKEFMARHPIPTGRGSVAGRAAAEGRAVQIADVQSDPEYGFKEGAKLGGLHTMLGVPLLREDSAIGVIALSRKTVRPFTAKQIELVETFADQAVIAIENARLLGELRQRTTELTQSLEQQTATAEVLSVISRSKFELQPILQSVVDTAARLCRADQAVIFRLDRGLYRFAAGHSIDPAYLEIERQNPIAPGTATVIGRAAMHRKVVSIDDALSDPLYEKKQEAKIAGIRSMIGVPLTREGAPIGVIALARGRVEPFAEREIEIVSTFADQAVIAIENVRLFEAEQQRARELSESLEQQTATSEVLRVISSSPGDLQPVFASMLENAVRVCGATFGNLWLREGDVFRIGATYGAQAAWSDFLSREPTFRVDPRFGLGRLIVTKQTYQVLDIAVEPTHQDKLRMATIELAHARTLIGVPLLRDDDVIGAIVIYRQEVRPFTDQQIEVVESFANQAVIAIENARPLTELRQRTDDLTEDWSSGRRHRKCFRLLVALQAILSRYLLPCWRTQRASAGPSSAS